MSVDPTSQESLNRPDSQAEDLSRADGCVASAKHAMPQVTGIDQRNVSMRRGMETFSGELAEGSIPIELIRAFGIVDPSTMVSQAIQEPLHNLRERLGFTDAAAARTTFLVFESEVPGVHFLEHSSPAIVLLSSATLQGNNAAENVDAFAYMLARALHHAELFLRHGERCSEHLGQGTPDFRAVESVQHAGFSPTACLGLLPKLIRLSDGRFHGVGCEHYINHSPEPNERVLAVYAGLAHCAKTYGRVNSETTPLSQIETLVNLFSSVGSTSAIEQWARRIEFINKSPEEQLELLAGAILEAPELSHAVISDIINVLESVGKGEVVESEKGRERVVAVPATLVPTREARLAFLNSLGELVFRGDTSAFIDIFKIFNQKWNDTSVLDESDLFGPARFALRAFLSAEDAEEIGAAAVEFEQIATEDPNICGLLHAVCGEVSWPGFGKARRGPAKEWDAHIGALKVLEGKEALITLDILRNLNLNDKRIYQYHEDLNWSLMMNQNAGSVGFLSAGLSNMENAQFLEATTDFLFEHMERLVLRLEDPKQREAARREILFFDDIDGWEYIKELSKNDRAERVMAKHLIEADPVLFLSLNRLALRVPALQERIVSTLDNLIDDEVTLKFFQALTQSEYFSDGYLSATALGDSTTWADIPLLRYAIENLELPPEIKWKVVEKSGVFSNLYLRTSDAGKIEDFLDAAIRPLLAELVEEADESLTYPDDIAVDWKDLFSRLALPGIVDLPERAALADLEGRVLLDDTPPQIADVVVLNELVPIYSERHAGLRQAIVLKTSSTLSLSDQTSQAVREWAALHRFNLFNSRETAYRLLTPLVSSIEALPDAAARRDLVEEILLAPAGFSSLSLQIYDRPLVDRLTGVWCRAVKENFNAAKGIDDGSDDALKEGAALATQLAERAPASYQKAWLQQLAKAIETQEELTRVFKRCVDHLTDDLASSTAVLEGMGKELEGFLHSSAFIRRATMEMLLGQGSDFEIKIFVDSVLENHRITCEREEVSIPAPARNLLTDWASLAHRLFPQYSVEQQTLRVMKMLAPPHIPDPELNRNAVVAPSAKEETAALRTILSYALPSENAQRALGGYIDAYFTGLDQYERFSTATLLLHAEYHRRMHSEGIGYSFALACKEMGPFETWLAQNAQSNPAVSKKLRDSMSHVDIKTNVNEPDRWDALPWIRAALPQSDYDALSHFGDTLGSGKVWVTFGAYSNDFGREALQLRRPHAHGLIDAGFSRWKRGSRLMAERGLNTSFLDGLVPSAYQSCVSEADVSRSPLQFEVARRLLQGRQVDIEYRGVSRHYDYRIPELISFGQNDAGEAFRRMTRLEGPHFIDLEREGVLTSEIMMISAANFSEFLSHLFAAAGHNKDPHGGNNRVNGSSIGCFDFGGIDPNTAPSEEVSQFADIFFSAAFSPEVSTAFSERVMIEVGRRAHEKEKVSPFTYSAVQSLLAMSEYMNRLPEELFYAGMAAAGRAEGTHVAVRSRIDTVLGSGGGTGVVDTQRRLFEGFYLNPIIQLS